VIIPTKNEPYIQTLVDQINRLLTVDHEILVIDKSDSLPEVRNAIVVPQSSTGLGNAVVEGISRAKGDVIAVMDGDGSHDPQDLAAMVPWIDRCEIVIGSRFVPGGKTEDVQSRRWVSDLFALLTRIILSTDLKDPMTGFIVARRSVFDRITLRPRGYKFVIETIYKSRAKVREHPITFHARKVGTSNVGFNMKGFIEACRIAVLLVELRLGIR
jgi:dolichol-phosphate mannosyltransferase